MIRDIPRAQRRKGHLDVGNVGVDICSLRRFGRFRINYPIY
jgi:hypothetical protein